jgi:hypothetical protein
MAASHSAGNTPPNRAARFQNAGAPDGATERLKAPAGCGFVRAARTPTFARRPAASLENLLYKP